MVANFLKYLEDKFPLTDAERELITEVCVVKKMRKRQYLLQEGDLWLKNAFVSKGIFRSYRVDDRGHEHIFQFSPENWWTGDPGSYFTEAPAKLNIDALEDSEVVLITKQDYQRILKTIPALGDFAKTLLERSFVASQDRIHCLISSTAEEKYQEFIKTYPNIINRVPQHMIASYLGISAETLSRVRNTMVKK